MGQIKISMMEVNALLGAVVVSGHRTTVRSIPVASPVFRVTHNPAASSLMQS